MKSNPFSTRFVAPGRLDWVGSGSLEIDNLVDRFLNQLQSRAAIVGPHGSGKSTLLEHLIPQLGTIAVRKDFDSHGCKTYNWVKTGKTIVWLQLRGRVASASAIDQSKAHWNKDAILVVDGFEQLSPFRRLSLQLATRNRTGGLLVTCHFGTFLPTLCHTNVTLDTAVEIINRLTSDQHRHLSWNDCARLEQLLKYHAGNFREVLMDYYDQVETADMLASRSLAPPLSLAKHPK